jgi:hypothetical protein
VVEHCLLLCPYEVYCVKKIQFNSWFRWIILAPWADIVIYCNMAGGVEFDTSLRPRKMAEVTELFECGLQVKEYIQSK